MGFPRVALWLAASFAWLVGAENAPHMTLSGKGMSVEDANSTSSKMSLVANQGGGFNVLFVGDYGMVCGMQSAVAEGMNSAAAQLNPVAIVGLGDNIYQNGASEEVQIIKQWQDVYITGKDALHKPWYVIAGNHDWRSNPKVEIGFTNSKDSAGFWKFPHLWYKETLQQNGVTVDMFFVDTMIWLLRADTDLFFGQSPVDMHKQQAGWLASALASSGATWKVVMGHHPLYTTGHHSSDAIPTAPDNMKSLDDLMRKNGVQIYLNGHNHNQELFEYEGVTYITSGNGAKAYADGGGCIRGFSEAFIPAGASEANSKFFNCGGGFASLNFGPSQVQLVFHNAGGHTFSDPGVVVIEKRQPTLLKQALRGFAVMLSDEKDLCEGRPLLRVDTKCGSGCRVLPDMDKGSTCQDFCNGQGLACVSASLTTDGANDECEVKSAAPDGCDHKADDDQAGLMCECGAVEL